MIKIFVLPLISALLVSCTITIKNNNETNNNQNINSNNNETTDFNCLDYGAF